MRNTCHMYGRSPDGGVLKRGFQDYIYQRGDTRKDLIAGMKFVGDMAIHSKTAILSALLLTSALTGEITGINQLIRDKLATVLIGKSK